ncbi:MAG: ADP-glyceromanno-heptose 6-epimerase [Chromatiales bacterium]|nr:ADP-glyceromanno-heptose 6-epimerase [Chromatiales bacterium]
MIIVTGGAGFIGSNLLRALNARGETDILVVDDLRDGRKMLNLTDVEIADYLDRDDFLARLKPGASFGRPVRAVFHQGACTETTEWDGLMMMRVNFEFSRVLLHWCASAEVPLIYASSASVYGSGRESAIDPASERPINVYAFSKLMFDRYLRRQRPALRSQVAGMRYFNVYGPGEAHKGAMASVVWHFHRQLQSGDELRLFAGSDGFADGEQRRDFIHVDDVVAVNLWLYDNPGVSGIFNVGTGESRSFNDVARAIIDFHGRGRIRYIPFPEHLAGSYQSFTEADLSGLRAAGYSAGFLTVEQGVRRYLEALTGRRGD